MTDPRHGTVAGYNRIPCRDECCRRAMANYKKRWEWDRLHGRERRVSTLGTQRRVASLAWLGWSQAEVARRAGVHPTNLTRLLTAETMTVTVAARFAVVYEDLAFRFPECNAQAISNVRARARRRGAVPPLAWDNIDDPAEQPTGLREATHIFPAVDVRAEAIREVLDRGGNQYEAARVLGISTDALEKWMDRHGMRGQLNTLRSRAHVEDKFRNRRYDEGDAA